MQSQRLKHLGVLLPHPSFLPTAPFLTLHDLQPPQLLRRRRHGGGCRARRAPHRLLLLSRCWLAGRCGGLGSGRCWRAARLGCGRRIRLQRDGGARRARRLRKALGRPHLLAQPLQGGPVVRQVVLLRADHGAGAAHTDVAHGLLRREPKVLDHVRADEHAGAAQASLAVHLVGRRQVGATCEAVGAEFLLRSNLHTRTAACFPWPRLPPPTHCPPTRLSSPLARRAHALPPQGSAAGFAPRGRCRQGSTSRSAARHTVLSGGWVGWTG